MAVFTPGREMRLDTSDAQVLYMVPESTLRLRLKNPCPNPHGGKPIFTQFKKESFVSLCKGFETMKLTLTRSDFLSMVKADSAGKT